MAIENEFNFVGRIARVPDLKQTPNGTDHALYVIAVPEFFYDSKKQKQTRTDFFAIHSYGRQAVNDARYLKKGSVIIVKGRIKQWRDEVNRTAGIYFEAEHVKYMDSASQPGIPQKEQDNPDIADFVAEIERAELSYSRQAPF